MVLKPEGLRTILIFMTYRMISYAILSVTPQVAPQVTPQVRRLVNVLNGEMTRDEIQIVLGLKDRKSFRER